MSDGVFAPDGSNIHQIRPESDKLRQKANTGDGNGGGGDDVELIKRVENLEKSLAETREKAVRIETLVESIQKHGSTKADVEAMGLRIIQWMILTGIGLAGLAFAAARYIHP